MFQVAFRETTSELSGEVGRQSFEKLRPVAGAGLAALLDLNQAASDLPVGEGHDGIDLASSGAVLGMQVSDYYSNGRRSWIRLQEKGGKFHEVPVHHEADDYLHAYIAAAGIAEEGKQTLWRTAQGRTQRRTGNALQSREAIAMIKRRAKTADLPPMI